MPVTDNVIRLLGRYSEGLRLTAEHGPASGVVCEYAYENTPQGSGALGRLIDRTFLHLSACDTIRQRIHTTKELVAEIVAARRAARATTLILDVAAGTGRYLRELAHEHHGDDLEIICHDRDPRQVTLARQLAAAEQLQRFTCSVGDATDDSSYLTRHDPNVVLAVGLFQYLRHDDAVRTVMRLALSHLAPGGCFLCTTLTDVPSRLGRLETNGFAARPAARAPETIATWLRATGFLRIDQRFSHPNGFALIGWKPDEA